MAKFVGTAIKYGPSMTRKPLHSTCSSEHGVPRYNYPRGNVEQLVEMEGSKLVGTRIKAPFTLNPDVFVLPMDGVLATKVHLPVMCRVYD